MFTHNVIKDVFTFAGRSGRVEYLIFSIVYLICTIALFALAILPVKLIFPFAEDYAGIAIGVLFLSIITLMAVQIIYPVSAMALLIRRIRDTGLSPWCALAFAVPFINIIFWIFLLFAPKDTVKKKLTDSQT